MPKIMSNARRILIVEDEPLIAMMLEDFLDSLGHEVKGICESVGEAHDAVVAGGFDLAILDVNLKGENIWPVASELKTLGIPFVIASGGHVDPPPAEFANVPMIDKPYTIDRVTPAIDDALAQEPAAAPKL
jgi:CheY-like chemotaxis protein